jgi:thiol-disulfide isomerase/thioredoxin
MPELTSHLLQFGGTECTHCHEMDPLVEKLQKEENVVIQYLESWHNEENANMLAELDAGRCGGVPFFYNTKTKKFICGSCEYEILKAWALGQ